MNSLIINFKITILLFVCNASMCHTNPDGMLDQNTTTFTILALLPLNSYKWFRLAVPNWVVGRIHSRMNSSIPCSESSQQYPCGGAEFIVERIQSFSSWGYSEEDMIKCSMKFCVIGFKIIFLSFYFIFYLTKQILCFFF